MKVSWAAQFLSTARVSVTAVRENAPVLLMTGIAFGGSYGHIAELCGRYGPHGWVQYATAGCVDLLCVIGAEERQRDKRIGRARNGKKVTWPTLILFIGIMVTLAANAATADRSFLGYCVAAWPAAALLLAVSILERRASYEIPLRIEHDELRAELESGRAALEAESAARRQAEAERDTVRQELAGAEVEREATLRERDTARAEVAVSVAREATLAAEVERLRVAAEQCRADAAKPASARRRPDATSPQASSASPGADDIDAQAEALAILAAEPDISGSELGRRLGFKPSYGRTLRRKLTTTAPGGGS